MPTQAHTLLGLCSLSCDARGDLRPRPADAARCGTTVAGGGDGVYFRARARLGVGDALVVRLDRRAATGE